MNLNWRGAFIMFLLDYFVLLRVYKRSQKLEMVSLFIAPLMVLIASAVAGKNIIKLFIVFALMELPLSIIGYDITPDASILERVIVATSFGVVSSIA